MTFETEAAALCWPCRPTAADVLQAVNDVLLPCPLHLSVAPASSTHLHLQSAPRLSLQIVLQVALVVAKVARFDIRQSQPHLLLSCKLI
jgi:hypothetical protein